MTSTDTVRCGRPTSSGGRCRRLVVDDGPCGLHAESTPSEPEILPAGVAVHGRGAAFWRSVLEEFEPRLDELEMLAEAARMLDLVDVLRRQVGPLVVGGKVSPVLVELRQVREQLRKTMSQLELPYEADVAAGDGDGGGSSSVADFRAHRARKAARVRWDNHA